MVDELFTYKKIVMFLIWFVFHYEIINYAVLGKPDKDGSFIYKKKYVIPIIF